MRRAGHIETRVQCQACPLARCLECRPVCSCGEHRYLSHHNSLEFTEDRIFVPEGYMIRKYYHSNGIVGLAQDINLIGPGYLQIEPVPVPEIENGDTSFLDRSSGVIANPPDPTVLNERANAGLIAVERTPQATESLTGESLTSRRLPSLNESAIGQIMTIAPGTDREENVWVPGGSIYQ